MEKGRREREREYGICITRKKKGGKIRKKLRMKKREGDGERKKNRIKRKRIENEKVNGKKMKKI